MEEIEKTLTVLAGDEVGPVKEEASTALGKFMARKKFPEFMGTLTSGKPEEKMRVIYAAEEMGGDEGLKLLMKAVEDNSDDVRGAAIRILEHYPRAEVLQVLVERLPRESGFVLGNLLSVLGRSGRKEITPLLLKYVNYPDNDIQARAIEALGRIGSSEAMKEILSRATSESPSVRKAVAYALGSISLRHGS